MVQAASATGTIIAHQLPAIFYLFISELCHKDYPTLTEYPLFMNLSNSICFYIKQFSYAIMKTKLRSVTVTTLNTMLSNGYSISGIPPSMDKFDTLNSISQDPLIYSSFYAVLKNNKYTLF